MGRSKQEVVVISGQFSSDPELLEEEVLKRLAQSPPRPEMLHRLEDSQDPVPVVLPLPEAPTIIESIPVRESVRRIDRDQKKRKREIDRQQREKKQQQRKKVKDRRDNFFTSARHLPANIFRKRPSNTKAPSVKQQKTSDNENVFQKMWVRINKP